MNWSDRNAEIEGEAMRDQAEVVGQVIDGLDAQVKHLEGLALENLYNDVGGGSGESGSHGRFALEAFKFTGPPAPLGGVSAFSRISSAAAMDRNAVSRALMALRDRSVNLTRKLGITRPQTFGAVADAIFKAEVRAGVAAGDLPAHIRTSPASLNVPGSSGVDVWSTRWEVGWDLTTARVKEVAGHDIRYIGRRAPDGTMINDVIPLVYRRR
jgi:hypothetical protein